MKTNRGLLFVALILLMLVSAVAVRALEVNKRRRAAKAFTLTIHDRTLVRLSRVDSFEADLAGNATDYGVCFRHDKAAEDKPLHAGNMPAATCGSKTGSPHVQQTMTFASAEKLKVIVDDLQMNRAKSTPTPGKAPPTSSPAPQVQQHVESTTPQAAKAITVALSR